MEGKRVEMKVTKEKQRRKNRWLKERKKTSPEPPVQEGASEEHWWRADPDKLNQEELVKLHDRFVQFHNALCDEITERLAGSSSNMVAPEKVQPWEDNRPDKKTMGDQTM